jgi:tetratricopeptide (TPR) repeat protein
MSGLGGAVGAYGIGGEADPPWLRPGGGRGPFAAGDWRMRNILIAVLAALSFGTVARAEDPAVAADATALDKAMQTDDCAGGLPVARKFVAEPVFDRLTDDVKEPVLSFAADCAVRQKLYEEAYDDARKATQLAKAEDWLWTLRLELAIQLNRPDDVVDTVRALTMVSRPALNAVTPQLFFTFEQHQKDAHQLDPVRQVFALLEKADYTPDAPAESPDGVWMADAQMAADGGDATHAAAVVGRIVDVDALMYIGADRRFTTIVAADPEHFDLKVAQERQLARDQAGMKAAPDSLALAIKTVRDLRALGRFDEALAMDQSAIDRANRSPKDKPAFSDQERQLNWALDAKADILGELGRWDEALDLQRAAAKITENGAPNVSQTINLAGLLVDEGHPAEALDALRVFDQRPASPYGVAWVHAERACADQQLGRDADVATEMAFLDAHSGDNPGARMKAHLCANQLDGAAAAMIAELRDPCCSLRAVVILSEFDSTPNMTPYAAARAARFALVAARPDVRAAVAEAGQTQRIHLCRDAFVDTD